ncbi:MAG TPA: tripartite tricarboxylate transporter substrate binding protein [Eoetvoesiella sp.]
MQKHSFPSRRTFAQPLAAVAMLFLTAAASLPLAHAQTFPSRPITLVVGYPPGGSNDLVARMIAPRLEKELGVTVVVDNRTGANGTIGAMHVIKSQPNGYTLLFSSASPIVLAPQTIVPRPFDTLKDLAGINMVGLTPEAVTVGPKLKVKTLKEMLTLARTQQITFASSGTGGLPHLTIELLKQASKGNILHVPYRGGGPATADVLGGHVDGVVQDLAPLFGLINEGQLTALAVTSKDRVEFLPNVPAASEELPGFNVVNWLGVFAPAKTPADVVAKIDKALQKIVAQPDFRQQLHKVAIVPTVLDSPAEFQKFLNDEVNRWGDVIKNTDLTQKS